MKEEPTNEDIDKAAALLPVENWETYVFTAAEEYARQSYLVSEENASEKDESDAMNALLAVVRVLLIKEREEAYKKGYIDGGIKMPTATEIMMSERELDYLERAKEKFRNEGRQDILDTVIREVEKMIEPIPASTKRTGIEEVVGAEAERVPYNRALDNVLSLLKALKDKTNI